MKKGMTVKKTKDNTQALKAAVSGQQLLQGVRAGALVLETKVKISMSASSHSGLTYGNHTASAPGETPSVDTGVLVNSISTWDISSDEKSAFEGCGTGVIYGVFLEFGTSKMKARPFMRPGVDNNLDLILSTVSYFAKQSIEGAAK